MTHCEVKSEIRQHVFVEHRWLSHPHLRAHDEAEIKSYSPGWGAMMILVHCLIWEVMMITNNWPLVYWAKGSLLAAFRLVCVPICHHTLYINFFRDLFEMGNDDQGAFQLRCGFNIRTLRTAYRWSEPNQICMMISPIRFVKKLCMMISPIRFVHVHFTCGQWWRTDNC